MVLVLASPKTFLCWVIWIFTNEFLPLEYERPELLVFRYVTCDRLKKGEFTEDLSSRYEQKLKQSLTVWFGGDWWASVIWSGASRSHITNPNVGETSRLRNRTRVPTACASFVVVIITSEPGLVSLVLHEREAWVCALFALSPSFIFLSSPLARHYWSYRILLFAS